MLSIQHVLVLICRIRNNFEKDVQLDKNRINILITDLFKRKKELQKFKKFPSRSTIFGKKWASYSCIYSWNCVAGKSHILSFIFCWKEFCKHINPFSKDVNNL